MAFLTMDIMDEHIINSSLSQIRAGFIVFFIVYLS